MIIILIIAAFISWAASGDFVDAVVILAVVLMNAILGVYQEQQAEEAIDALAKMNAPEANVLRDGEIKHIASKGIVPGDIIILEAGDIVPADMYIIEGNSLQIEEAALTGESVPVNKSLGAIQGEIGIGDRTNMGFSSTNVTYGRGVGIVTATGMQTEVGHIAKMIDAAEKQKTPLQRDQEKLAKILTVVVVVVAAANFAVGVFINDTAWVNMLLVAVSLAVAALPEGLPAITTIILSQGTQKMAARNALVRSLPAVETLGSTMIIASDKTGTLTQNKMTVEKVYFNSRELEASESLSKNSSLYYGFAFPNDTGIKPDGTLTGDPTETAMTQYALNQGFDVEGEIAKAPRVGEVPFDSGRKLMSTIHKTERKEGKYTVYVKGAPDQLLERCTHIEKDGMSVPITQDDKNEILAKNAEFARNALRVLGGAYRYIDEIPTELNTETVENELVFSGLMAMIDPERPEARQSVIEVRNAGVRTIMITGDHALTAQAIAERLTILDENDPENVRHVCTGAELNEMSDEELAKKVNDYSVYARVSPEHKVRIINAWQANDKIISMTGDGVNDAPALKQANIGVGMGITGTEVSKGASDMVLADDNFATIVSAIEEGRKVFANIQKAVQFLLSANMGEVLTLSIATLLGWQILEPIHILWINLVTDVFPAIALGMEKAEPDIMEYEPRDKNSSFFSNGVGFSIIYQGIIEAALTLGVYWYASTYIVPTMEGDAHLLAETMAFATLGMIQLFHAYNVKSVFKSIFSQNPFNNKYLNIACLVSGALLVGVVVIPGINDLFDVIPPTIEQWGIIIGAAVMMVVLVEIVKAILRAMKIEERFRKKTAKDVKHSK